MKSSSTVMNSQTAGVKAALCLPLVIGMVAAQAQPSITSQPTNQTVLLGANAAFSVAVSDAGPVTFLWQFNGSNVLNQLITIAGKNTNSYSGDNGPATNATLNNPRGVCADSFGNVYIADTANQRVRKVAANGIITTIAGRGSANYFGDGGQATNAYLDNPLGMAMDAAGRLYIADSGNNRIRRINTNGVISTVAGDGTAGYSGDNAAATNAELYGPAAVTLDVQGNLYIADNDNQRVRKVATNGIITTVASGLNGPVGVAVDIYGEVYIAESMLSPTITNTRVQVEYDGIVQTIAGNGTIGFSGDGGAATKAQLALPYDVAVLSYANYYIADSANNRIRQVNTNGVISTVAGNWFAGTNGDGSVATNASLFRPVSLSLDPAGNLYIADQLNNRIREMSPFATGSNLLLRAVPEIEAGSYTVIVSDASGSVTSSVAILTVATAPAITAQPVNQSTLFGGDATFSVIASGTPPLSYQWLRNATNIVQAGSSNMLALAGVTANNEGSYSVVVSNAYGAVTSQVATLTAGFAPTIITQPASQLLWPGGNALFSVVVSGQGPFGYQWQLSGVNLPNNIIETVAGDGFISLSNNTGPATNAALSYPTGVAADAAGNVYIANSRYYRVQKVDVNGMISTVAGGISPYTDTGDGGLAVAASLGGANAVALDAEGNLYIGEASRVRRVGTNGIITTVAGTSVLGFSGDGGPAVNAELNAVMALACDSAGNLYLADQTNNRIRKVSSNGIISTMAGTGTAGYNGDNIVATNAELNLPAGVAVDASGNVYIGDWRNYLVRKVAPNGVITTIAGDGYCAPYGDGGLAINAYVCLPAGLTLDASGDLYVADQDNQHIREITTAGYISTVAGNYGGSPGGFSGDGGAATNADLYWPQAVALDSLGNLYIADVNNQRIREVCFAGPPTLYLTNVSSANGGNYTVVISNAFGSVTSSVFSLEIIVQPDIGGIAFQADGSVAINFTGTPEASHVLLMATNLSPPVWWSPIATNLTAANGAGQLVDTNTQAPARFYRVALVFSD